MCLQVDISYFIYEVIALNNESNNSAAPPNLLESIKLLKPTALVGVSAQGGAFNEEVSVHIYFIKSLMCRRLIFVLLNYFK